MPRLLMPIEFYQLPLTENPEIGTRFKPEPPFDMYTRGVVYYDKRENRRAVTLYTPASENEYGVMSKKNMYVSTYLYSVKLFSKTKNIVPCGYEVDHKDNDQLNDTLENLQLLTRFKNAQKEGLRVGALWCRTICPVCLKQTDLPYRNSPLSIHCKGLVFCCSGDCRVIFRSTLLPYKKFQELRDWISENQAYQTVRKWKEENREVIVETINEKMLNFDLAVASGREIKHNTPRLLDELSKINLVRELRRDGKSWEGIGSLFGLSGSQARHLYMDETTGCGVGGRRQFIHSEIIRLSGEGKSTGELAKMFNIDPNSITRIKREKGKT